MKITAIVCTYNRCESLAKTLNSMATSVLPQSIEWEVLVVDNNSNDGTRACAEEFCRRDPAHFRYLFEPRPGKSYALNSGIREAYGDVLAFTDDDVIVDANWLASLTQSLSDGKWSGVGGRTFAEKSFVPPRWIPRNGLYALAPFAVFDRGDSGCELKEAPFGNNMAFRKAMFEKHSGFRTDLGPRFGSNGPQKSEDSEFGTRLLEAGEHFYYEPRAVVYHAVPESRVRREYFLDWWFDKARSDLRASGLPAGALSIGGVPIYLLRRLGVWTVRWLLTINPSRRFEAKIKVWGKRGEIVEARLLAKEKNGK